MTVTSMTASRQPKNIIITKFLYNCIGHLHPSLTGTRGDRRGVCSAYDRGGWGVDTREKFSLCQYFDTKLLKLAARSPNSPLVPRSPAQSMGKSPRARR